jgi:hypothetical protein
MKYHFECSADTVEEITGILMGQILKFDPEFIDKQLNRPLDCVVIKFAPKKKAK